MGLGPLLASREIVVTCGAGGVGKTTTAAALGAIAATRLGGRVLVLTVDPARRLADALGLTGPGGTGLGNTERRIDPSLFQAAGTEPRGELWAAMLDTKQSWDELITRHAPDPSVRAAILANPLYDNITGKFVQSHDYIAMERLHELHASGDWDLIVVDTPPSRHALDFLDAPARMTEFFGSRLLRWLTVPYRSKLFAAASRPFYDVADRILGSSFLHDIAEFFLLFQTMERGFVARAAEVTRVLSDRRTSFVVVSTLETGPLGEARYFLDALDRRRLALGGVVLNQALPAVLRDPSARAAADRLRADPDAVARRLAGIGDLSPPSESVALARVLSEIAESFVNLALVATREAELATELRIDAPTVLVPSMPSDVADLTGLLAVGDRLW
ncbi:MAG: ArsA family ATPase [Acidimicrobiales bacterium]